MGTGRIAGLPRQKRLFRSWCTDHGGQADVATKHKRSIGPGANTESTGSCHFEDGRSIEWETVPGGKEVTIDYGDGQVVTERFSDIRFDAGGVQFTKRGDGNPTEFAGVTLDNPAVRWSREQTEPSHGYGYRESVVGEGYGREYDA